MFINLFTHCYLSKKFITPLNYEYSHIQWGDGSINELLIIYIIYFIKPFSWTKRDKNVVIIILRKPGTEIFDKNWMGPNGWIINI